MLNHPSVARYNTFEVVKKTEQKRNWWYSIIAIVLLAAIAGAALYYSEVTWQRSGDVQHIQMSKSSGNMEHLELESLVKKMILKTKDNKLDAKSDSVIETIEEVVEVVEDVAEVVEDVIEIIGEEKKN